MIRFAVRRLGAALLLVWIVLTSTFFLLHVAPGDPIRIFEGPNTTPDQSLQLRRYYGLDKPLLAQYGIWLGAVARGDWGVSIAQQRSVVLVLAERFPNTVVLVLAVLVVEYGFGASLGVVAAARAGSWLDRLIRILALVFYAIPVFWLGLLLIDLLAVRLHLFPIGHLRSDQAIDASASRRFLDLLHHLVLPALALGLARAAIVIRFVRTGLVEILNQDYIRTAQAIGLGSVRILWVHALRNTLGPLVQRFGFTLPGLLSGTVVAEVVFSWPGFGRVIQQALIERDYPVVLGATGLTAVLVVVCTFLTDLAHAALDPRIRRP